MFIKMLKKKKEMYRTGAEMPLLFSYLESEDFE